MPTPLLATKTYLPQPVRGGVERARLRGQLDQARQGGCRLALVSSMAGSGKSLLLADWAAVQSQPVAWLSLDAQDNRLPIFWAYLIAALQRHLPGFGQGLMKGLLSPQPPAESEILAEFLIQAEAVTAPLTLVLDDYHLIENPEIHESLVYLVEHLPAPLLLVLCTRSDPPLPLSRWRVRGSLVEIRADDLRFNSGEVAAFFHDFMQLNLDAEDLALLETKTEGWAAGLQLAALVLKGADAQRDRVAQKALIARFSANHQHVLDYLTSEVLNQQPAEVREFLLKTSILKQLSGELCQAVTGQPASAELLAALRQKNLFLIPQDDEGLWYRYHHLFADTLRIRLASLGAENLHQLHLLAARWYEQAGRVDDFLFHALEAGEHDYAARVVNRNWRRATDEGWPNLALGWLETLPPATLRAHPMLSMACAWTQWLRGRALEALERGEDALAAHQAWLENQRAPQGDYEFDTLPSQVAALRALVAVRQERLETAIEQAREAIRLAHDQVPFAPGLAYMALATALRDQGKLPEALENYRAALELLQKARNRITVTNTAYNLGRLLQVQGRLAEAERLFTDLLAQTAQVEPSPADAILRVGLGEVYYERDQREQAAVLSALVTSPAHRGGYLELIKNGSLLRARLLRAEGDLPGALTVLQEALDILQRTDARALVDETRSELARCQAEAGQRAAALVWANGLRLPLEGMPSVAVGIQLLNLARVRLLAGETAAAQEIARFIEQAALATGSLRWQAEALLLRTLAAEQSRQVGAAQALLGQTLALTAPNGHLRLYADFGPVLQARLKALYPQLADPALARYAAQVLQAFTAPAVRGARELVEPLSKREIQVLRLVSLGATNQEIADRLVISLPTVKTHVRHILEKLNAQNRVEAVSRAKELGLL